MATCNVTGKSSWEAEITYSTSFNNGSSSITFSSFRLRKASNTTVASTGTGTFYLYVNNVSYSLGKMYMEVPKGGAWSSSVNCNVTISNLTPGSGVSVGFDDIWNNLWSYNKATTTAWSAGYPTYTISYNANGGSGAPNNQTKTWGTDITLSSTKPTRTNYDFLGWSTSSTATSASYASGAKYTNNADLALYAVWKLAKPTFTTYPTLTGKTETSITYSKMAASISGSTFEYKINSNGSWKTANANGDTISGLSPSTQYTIYFRAYYNGSKLYSDEYSKSETTYGYPYIKEFTSKTLNVGETRTISFYNPLKRNLEITATVNGNNILSGTATKETTAESITLTFDNALCSTALGSTKTSGTLTYNMHYTLVNSAIDDQKTDTLSLPASIGAPKTDISKVNNFIQYVDWNTEITALTTGNSVLLGGYSKIKITPSSGSTNNPFTPMSPATITSYKMQINNGAVSAISLGSAYYQTSSNGVTSSSSNSAVVSNSATVLSVTITATDSRGFTNSVTRSITITPYTRPTVNIINIVRSDGYGTTATLNSTWGYSKGLSLSKGTFKVQLYYRESGGGSSWTLYPSNITTNPQSINNIFDSAKAYNVKLKATDSLGQYTETSEASIGIGDPIFFIDSGLSAVGVNCFPKGKGLYVNGTASVTSNVDFSNYKCNVDGNNTNNYPWRRIMYNSVGTGIYNDNDTVLEIRHNYNDGGYGRVKISCRTNASGNSVVVSAKWLYRYNIPANSIAIGEWGKTGENVYYDVFYKSPGGWPRCKVYKIPNQTHYGTLVNSWEADNTTTSDRKSSYECYKDISNDAATKIRGKAYTQVVTGADAASVSYAATAGSASSCTGNAATATTASSCTGNAKNVTEKKSLSSKSHSNWGTNNGYVPDMSFIAYWNGAHNASNNSNLTYCHQGTIMGYSASGAGYLKLGDGTLICYGSSVSGALAAGSGSNAWPAFNSNVSFVDTNYRVSVDLTSAPSYWSFINWTCFNKSTTGFQIGLWNNSGADISAVAFDWIAIGRWK